MPIPTTATRIERHAGLIIHHEEGSGYWAENGCDSFGYHDDIADLKAEIDDYWQGTEFGPLNGFFARGEA